MKTAVIIDACRTPVGRAHAEKGVFRDVRSDDLAVAVVRAIVERSGIDPAAIEDVVLGNTQQQREQGFNVARSVGLMAGLPVEAGGATVNRLCGSSLQAIAQASHAIRGRVPKTCRSSAVSSTCTIFRWMPASTSTRSSSRAPAKPR